MRDLTTLQSIPHETKILWAYSRVAETLEYCNAEGLTPLISLSGGKDSWVLQHIVRQIRAGVQAVFVNTGLEYPDVMEHARSADNVVELRPAIVGILHGQIRNTRSNGIPRTAY